MVGPAPSAQENVQQAMEALANPLRFAMMHRLGQPAFIHDLTREFEMSRQAVKKHLDLLVAAGLVQTRRAPRRLASATQYLADPLGLFVFKERIQDLAVHADASQRAPTPTVLAGMQPRPSLPVGAGLLLVHGEGVGRWFALGRTGAWVLGRDAKSDVPLAYDAFASGRHALVRHDADGWTVTDLGSTNATRLNLAPLPAGQPVPLRAGDLLTVGRSHLLFRVGP